MRILGLSFGFLILLVLLAARLFQLQILQHSHFVTLAEEQHWISYTIPAARGEIYSADGFPLVENQTAYLVYAEPHNLDDPALVAEKLTEILLEEDTKYQMSNIKSVPKPKDEFQMTKAAEAERIERALKQDLQWVPLAHKVSEEARQQIESLGFGGIGFEEEPRRFYPEKDLAAHLLGFVGQDDRGLDQGYYGLEGYYDGDLKGSPGRVVQEKDAAGAPIPVGGYKTIAAINGRELTLTLDRYLQFLIEGKLTAAVEKYGALGGTVIIMEPQTGAILAMADYPMFDPEEPEKLRWSNPAISETYEPGSVLKSLTMSAAIDSGIVTPQTTMMDSGPITVSGYKVDNWDGKHHGEETMIEILQHSNNIGAAWVGEQLGAKKLREYFLRFGLGQIAGVDLEGEDTGIVKEESSWRAIDLANAAFGQGISVTPLQLITAFAAIVNEGRLMRPFVVARITEDAKEINISPKAVRQVLSRKSAKIMVEMLTSAVEGGESKFYNLAAHKIAGKTGTAQIPVGGFYDPNKTNATFVGFLPSYPRFVMLTLLKQPSSSIYAAETTVPLFMEIMQEIIVYYGIEPDK